MKKQLLFASLILAISSVSLAQTRTPNLQGKLNSVSPKKVLPTAGLERNMTCGDDTLHYPLLKEELVSVAAPNYGAFPLMTGSASFGSAYSQAFLAASPSTINGVEFWGVVIDAVNPAQVLTVNVSVYNIGITNLPTTTLVATTTATLTGTTDAFYTVTFPVPPTVTGNYAIVVENPSLIDTLGIVVNDAKTTTYAEGLAGLKYSGTWYPITTLLAAPAAYEAIVAPIVSYPIATNFTASADPACVGTAVTFTNTTTPDGLLSNRMYSWSEFNSYWMLSAADSTYAWNFGDSGSITWGTNTSHTYSAAGNYPVTLTTLGGFWKSCMDSKVDTLPVVAPPVLFVTSPSAVCSPSTVDLTTAAVTAGSTGGGTLSYWNDVGATSALTTPNAVNANGTYYIQSSTAPGCSDIEPVMATINTTPSLMITDPGAVCQPNTVDLTATAVTAGSTGGGTLTYWADSSATIAVSTPAAVTSGTYYIQADNSGCMDIDSVTAIVADTAVASFTYNNSAEPMIAFTSTSTDASAYSWNFGDGSPVDNSANPTHTYTSVGTYTVTLTATNSCNSDTSAQIITIVSIGINNNVLNTLSVYPNPSNGVFTLDLGITTEAIIEVYNVIGAKVFGKEINAQISSVDLSGFDAGVYVLKVRTGNAQTVKQITVTK